MRSLAIELAALGTLIAAAFFFALRPLSTELDRLRQEKEAAQSSLQAMQQRTGQESLAVEALEQVRRRCEEALRAEESLKGVVHHRARLRHTLLDAGAALEGEGRLDAAREGSGEGIHEVNFTAPFVTALQALEALERDPEFLLELRELKACRGRDPASTSFHLKFRPPEPRSKDVAPEVQGTDEAAEERL
ncbi:MAG: hypothetical protein AB1486_15255 [Planctomycetota bacterium]